MDDPAGRWQRARDALDAHVAAGRLPGYAVAVDHAGETTIWAGGRMALDDDRQMQTGTRCRIASLTKPVGGALLMTLVERGELALDDEVGRWLPELAAPRVLRDPAGPLDRTVAADQPILVEQLATMTWGLGALFPPCPLSEAMEEWGVAPGPIPPQMDADEYIARIGGLPLAFQPGRAWLYHTGSDVLSVLVSRATGRSVAELVAERITGPLGMRDTGFWCDPDLLPAVYMPAADGLELFDPPDAAFARPPRFEALGSGLVSTVEDYLRFMTALRDGGGPILSAGSVEIMTSDRLTAVQRASSRVILAEGSSWGLNLEVDLTRTEPWTNPGRFGWNGGFGTAANVDPVADLTIVFFSQRMLESPAPPATFTDLWRAAYAEVGAG